MKALSEDELRYCIRGALDFIDSVKPLYSLPISTQRLAMLSGAKLCPYSRLTAAGIDVTRLLSCMGNKDGGFLTGNNGGNIIYNEAMPENRIRFTICEELMHMHLNHTANPAFNAFSQSYTEDEYDLCEQQAKLAACLLLCPPSLYLKHTLKAADIMRKCRVSESCAYRIIEIYTRHSALIRKELSGRPQLGTYYTV